MSTPYWGDMYWGPDTYWSGLHFTDSGVTQLLYMIREGSNVAAWAGIVDQRAANIMHATALVRDAFDPEDAVGAQLDMLGAALWIDRDGASDDDYRRAIRTQAYVLSSAQGSAATLQAIWEAWTGQAPASYQNVGPAHVEIGGQVDPGDEVRLGRFLRQAAPGGVVIVAHGYDLGDGELDDGIVLRGEYSQDPEAGTTMGITSYSADPVADAAITAYSF
jgi:hypothetical protein